MSRFAEILREKSGKNWVTDAEIVNLIPGTPDRRYALLKRALAKGDLIHLRRGLYLLGKRYQRGPVDLLVVAQKIYGPSYISLESALAHHGWISEAVRAVTSATSRRSSLFETPLGVFGFSRIAVNPFLIDVSRELSGEDSFWIAGPWKAIADYVYLYKKEWKGIAPLMESLRIEEEDIFTAKKETLVDLESAYRSRRVKRFLKGVRKDLG